MMVASIRNVPPTIMDETPDKNAPATPDNPMIVRIKVAMPPIVATVAPLTTKLSGSKCSRPAGKPVSGDGRCSPAVSAAC